MTTNYEKYRDEIVKFNYGSNTVMNEFCNNFVEPNILKPIGKECLNVDCTYCRMLMSIWLMDEYKESKKPEVDWSKISVDTKIYVKDNIDIIKEAEAIVTTVINENVSEKFIDYNKIKLTLGNTETQVLTMTLDTSGQDVGEVKYKIYMKLILIKLMLFLN